jgi:hypothetical protein
VCSAGSQTCWKGYALLAPGSRPVLHVPMRLRIVILLACPGPISVLTADLRPRSSSPGSTSCCAGHHDAPKPLSAPTLHPCQHRLMQRCCRLHPSPVHACLQSTSTFDGSAQSTDKKNNERAALYAIAPDAGDGSDDTDAGGSHQTLGLARTKSATWSPRQLLPDRHDGLPATFALEATPRLATTASCVLAQCHGTPPPSTAQPHLWPKSRAWSGTLADCGGIQEDVHLSCQ